MLWAAAAWVICLFTNFSLPGFLTFVLGGAFVGSSVVVTVRRQWKNIFTQYKALFFVAAAAAIINQLAYVMAFRLAPPEQVDLVYYLWPLMVAVGRSWLPGEQPDRRHLMGVALGLLGIALLMLTGSAYHPFAWQHLLGYGFALAAGGAWAVYSLMSRHYRSAPPELAGLACGPGAVLGCAYLLATGAAIPSNWPLAALWGFSCFGVSCFMWDLGVRRGNFKLLNALCYAVPIASIGILVLAGLAPLTWTLGLACLLVTAGSILATTSKPKSLIEHQEELAAA